MAFQETALNSSGEAGFRARADALLRWLHETYMPPGSGGRLSAPMGAKGVPDPQKYIWPKVLGRLVHDKSDAWALAAIDQFWKAGGDPAPHATSFYHFAAYGLARILFAFPEAIAPHRDAILKQAMEEEQLFSAPGTENHIAMWRTSGYLFAQEAGDDRRIRQMRLWIDEFAERLYANGQGEWDSSTYVAFDIASWLNLADYARDAGVKETARAVVDFFASALALKYVHGALAGAEKRGMSVGSANAISSYTGWLWFGDCAKPIDEKFFSQSAIYSVFPALSSYRPAPQIVALAHKAQWTKPETHRIGRPNYAMTAPSQAREVFYATRRYAVGASVVSPIGGWGGGDTQETLWKFAARAGDKSGVPSAYVIGGAGAGYAERHKYIGEGRSPWDQVALHESLLVQMTRVPPNAEELTAGAKALFETWKAQGNAKKVSWADPKAESWAYVSLPESAETEEREGILWVNLGGDAYAAVRPIHGAFSWVMQGVAAGRKAARTEGPRSELIGWVYEFGDRDADGDFETFARAVAERSRMKVMGMAVTCTGRNGHTLRAEFGVSGTYFEPEYDWGPQPKWPSGAGHGRVPRIWVNEKEMDLAARWPVYEGPRLTVKDSRLEVREGGTVYGNTPKNGR